MFKKFLSVLLAVMMVVSVMAVAVVTTSAAELESTKLYFDASGTGWDMSAANDKIGFYIYGGDLTAVIGFGGTKLAGTKLAGTDCTFGFDPTSVKYELHDGVQYKINFFHIRGKKTVAGEQTYDLFFDTTCLGHKAYSDGSMIENPVDSTKSTLAAYWEGLDASMVGPVLQVSSIGNVVGSCPAEGQTPYDIFVDFIKTVNTNTGVTQFANALDKVVKVGTKTEQKLIDDIGAALELSKDDIKQAFEDNTQDTGIKDEKTGEYTTDPKPITTTWSYDDSTLPSGSAAHEHTAGEPVQENVVPASCTAEGSYDEVVYCTECGEEISRETKTIDKLAHTPGEEKFENVVPASCTVDGSYDVVVYCTECGTEISRNTEVDPHQGHTTTEPVRENEIPATCTANGSYDEVVYCGNCNEEISRETKTIDKIAHDLTEVAEVPATEEAAGVKAHYVCSECGKKFADSTGAVEVTDEDLVIPALPHTHVSGDAVVENEVPADCENGGSYDEVVYCTKCGEEISRETKTTDPLGHEIVFVDQKDATATEDGMKAHYECTRCGKLFEDEEGKTEVNAEDLVIKAEHKRGDADTNGDVDIKDATTIQRVLVELSVPAYDEIAADADQDGVVDMVDVTLIQRIDIGMTTFEKWDAAHAE